MYVYLLNNAVIEIISEINPDFPDVPITERYSKEFLSQCVKVSDDTEVEQGWIYEPETKTFSEPIIPVYETIEE